jgi:hypothetical protein
MSNTVAGETLNKLVQAIQTRRKLQPAQAKTTWVEIVGSSPGDSLDQEAARLAVEWRHMEQDAPSH